MGYLNQNLKKLFNFLNNLKNSKIGKETKYALLSKVITVIFGLFFLIFVPILGGEEVYGTFSLIISYIFLLSFFVGIPINDAIRKEISENEEKSENSNKIFILAFKLKAIFSLLFFILFVLFLSLVNIQVLKENLILFVILIVLMNFWGLIVAYFESIHKLKYELIMFLIEYIVKFGLIIIFYFKFSLSTQNLLITFIVGYLIAFIYGFYIIYSKYNLRFKYSLFKEKLMTKTLLKRFFFLSFSSISFVMLTKIDLVIISLKEEMKIIAYYNIANELIKQSIIISVPIVLGMLPILAKQKNPQKLFKNTFYLLLGLNLILFLGFFFLSDFFISLIYGENYFLTTQVLQAFAILPLLMSIFFYFQQIIIIKDKTHILLVIGIIAAILNISLSIIFLELIGVVGIAYATIISYIIISLIAYYYVKKYLKN